VYNSLLTCLSPCVAYDAESKLALNAVRAKGLVEATLLVPRALNCSGVSRCVVLDRLNCTKGFDAENAKPAGPDLSKLCAIYATMQTCVAGLGPACTTDPVYTAALAQSAVTRRLDDTCATGCALDQSVSCAQRYVVDPHKGECLALVNFHKCILASGCSTLPSLKTNFESLATSITQLACASKLSAAPRAAAPSLLAAAPGLAVAVSLALAALASGSPS
jgi:hypothetical protein